MATAKFLIAEDRGVLAASGADAGGFLQGLVSNDVDKVDAGRAIYAALLTPQGRFLHDFFVARAGDSYLLDCEAGRSADLLRRLTIYRLRAKVSLEDAGANLAAVIVYGEGAHEALGLPGEAGAAAALAGGVVFVDPRTPSAGARGMLPRAKAAEFLAAAGLSRGDAAEYDSLRLRLGLPDGSRDLPVEKALLMENRFEELNGLDWDKGCYVGQELTARMKYRALVKKQLTPVRVDGPLPDVGAPIMAGDKEVGEMRSGRDGLALAFLRVDALEEAGALSSGDAKLALLTP
ncbi:MAG: folate-binding protein [Alphaproteobacteria bacterium]|nr:folate-binding protein [Alphaproteobacteria bacterium]